MLRRRQKQISTQPENGDSPQRKTKRSWLRRHLSDVTLALLVGVLALIFCYPLSVITIPSGHVGVLFSRFGGGTVTDFVLREGMRVKWPWDRIYLYDTRLQVAHEEYDVLSQDGVKMKVAVAIRYRIEAQNVPFLQKKVGEEYRDIILRSEIGSKLRAVLAGYSPSEIYSVNRLKLEQEIENRAQPDVERTTDFFDRDDDVDQEADFKLLHLDDIRIEAITLPLSISSAIERKKEQEQIAQEYIFRIDREKREAERKRIEAEGIRDFQAIVKEGISEEFLRWKGIDATVQLAESKNGKIIIFGAPKTGLPIILGDMETNSMAKESTSDSSSEGVTTRGE